MDNFVFRFGWDGHPPPPGESENFLNFTFGWVGLHPHTEPQVLHASLFFVFLFFYLLFFRID